eukprot:scaffold54030_cov57-Phaeocystis_antarctica.AAC.1
MRTAGRLAARGRSVGRARRSGRAAKLLANLPLLRQPAPPRGTTIVVPATRGYGGWAYHAQAVIRWKTSGTEGETHNSDR